MWMYMYSGAEETEVHENNSIDNVAETRPVL